MKFPCTLKNALLIIRDRFGLSFASKGLGYLAALLLLLSLLTRNKLTEHGLKEISSSGFGCSGNKYEYTDLRKPFPTRVSFFPLLLSPLNFYLTGSGWSDSLYPYSDRSYLACSILYRLQFIFRSAD